MAATSNPLEVPTVHRPKRHQKTFTGCWTCRSRKVKCDETRPACLQCRSKHLHCEGYFVRLQWMPSEQATGSRNMPRVKVQRSLIAADPVSQALDQPELDDILGVIDAYESTSSTRGSKDSLFVHSFGVFDPTYKSPESSSEGHTPGNASSNSEPPLRPVANNNVNADQYYSDAVTQVPNLLPDTDGSDLYLDGEIDLLPEANSIEAFTSSWLAIGDLPQPDPPASECRPESDVINIDPSFYAYAPSGTIIRNPTSSTLPEQEQFLMHHYSHHAVNLFCVIDNRKSPWKTIHLPRALQSIGQLNVSGSSSDIRNSLRNALLSISAFHLCNDNKARYCHDDAAKWSRKAIVLRGKAIELLKNAMNEHFKNKAELKYKEFLATMLSMVTINVMSGDTSTCGVHLEGALRFMTQARNWKTRFSPKARSLHRIYFYLQVIYQSTVVKQQNSVSDERRALTFDVPGPLEVPLAEIPDLAGVRQSSTDQDLSNPSLQMSTYECIYGLPQNMLILLNKITTLIREVTGFRETNKTHSLPEDLSVRCNDVERTVMDWPIELELERCRIDGMGASSEIIRQTTYAFHNALIIYFAQNIRLMNYRYLQPYVQTVLERIETIERVKTESGILAAPLYWPCFIAASEAFNEPLQRRFKRWYEEGKAYGFEAVRSGTNVLSEVWAQGPTAGSDLTSRWRMVVQEMDVHLMLS